MLSSKHLKDLDTSLSVNKVYASEMALVQIARCDESVVKRFSEVFCIDFIRPYSDYANIKRLRQRNGIRALQLALHHTQGGVQNCIEHIEATLKRTRLRYELRNRNLYILDENETSSKKNVLVKEYFYITKKIKYSSPCAVYA